MISLQIHKIITIIFDLITSYPTGYHISILKNRNGKRNLSHLGPIRNLIQRYYPTSEGKNRYIALPNQTRERQATQQED